MTDKFTGIYCTQEKRKCGTELQAKAKIRLDCHSCKKADNQAKVLLKYVEAQVKLGDINLID